MQNITSFKEVLGIEFIGWNTFHFGPTSGGSKTGIMFIKLTGSVDIKAWSSEVKFIMEKMNYDTSEIGENIVDLEHAFKTLLSLNQSAWAREA